MSSLLMRQGAGNVGASPQCCTRISQSSLFFSRVRCAAVALQPMVMAEAPTRLEDQSQEPQLQPRPNITQHLLRIPRPVTIAKPHTTKPSALRRARRLQSPSLQNNLQVSWASQEVEQVPWSDEDACALIQQASYPHASSAVTPQASEQIAARAVAAAQQLLMSLHRRYILFQVKRFKAALGDASELAHHELYMAGVLGLMQAARRWTPHMRGNFLTFAHYHIRANMMAAYRELQSSHVYIPRYLEDVRLRVLRSARALRAQEAAGGPAVSASAIAAHAGVSKKAVLDLASAMSLTPVVLDMAERDEEAGSGQGVGREGGMVSIDQVTAEEPVALWVSDTHLGARASKGGRASLGLRQAGPRARGGGVSGPVCEALMRHVLLDARLKEMLGQILTPRELQVVEAIGQGASVTEVAQRLGLSHQRVSQLQSRAQQKLEVAASVEGSELRAGIEELCSVLEG